MYRCEQKYVGESINIIRYNDMLSSEGYPYKTKPALSPFIRSTTLPQTYSNGNLFSVNLYFINVDSP